MERRIGKFSKFYMGLLFITNIEMHTEIFLLRRFIGTNKVWIIENYQSPTEVWLWYMDLQNDNSLSPFRA